MEVGVGAIVYRVSGTRHEPDTAVTEHHGVSALTAHCFRTSFWMTRFRKVAERRTCDAEAQQRSVDVIVSKDWMGLEWSKDACLELQK